MGEISMNYTYEWPWIIDDSIVRCIILSQIRADIVKQNVLLTMLVSVGSKKRFPSAIYFLKKQTITYHLIIFSILFERLTLPYFKIQGIRKTHIVTVYTL